MAKRRARARRRRRRGGRASRTVLVALLGLVLAAVALDRSEGLPPEARDALRSLERTLLGTDLLEEVSRSAGTPTVSGQAGLDYDGLRAMLATVTVTPERRSGYDRDDWPHWRAVRGCLDTREMVLIAESRQPVRMAPDGCTVAAGLWYDPYTDTQIRDPRALDVDHVVALQEAHESGGHAWSRMQRTAFANDLEDPRTLIAVSAEVNRAKGAQGPESWLPPNPAYRCTYLAHWIAIKVRWRLSMDESERVAVGNILAACEARHRSRQPD